MLMRYRTSHVLILILCLLFGGVHSLAYAEAPTWRSLATGLNYLTLPLLEHNRWEQGQLHVFRIDLHHYTLALSLAGDHGQRSAQVSELAKAQHATLGINGGFFSPIPQPLGLRIQDGIIRYPAKQTAWWGVLSMVDQQAQISSLTAFQQQHVKPEFALQTGPRLIINGQIPKLKRGLAQRSVIGIDKQGRILVAITENALIASDKLAALLRDTPQIACQDAINLDGGNSSQLYAAVGDWRLQVDNLSLVTDAILVLPRESLAPQHPQRANMPNQSTGTADITFPKRSLH